MRPGVLPGVERFLRAAAPGRRAPAPSPQGGRPGQRWTSVARPRAARARRSGPSGRSATAASTRASPAASGGGSGGGAAGAGGASCTKRSRCTAAAPRWALMRAISSVRQMLQFHRHRPGAGDGERAGGQPARQGDGGERRADDQRPVGQHLGGAGGAAAERGAGQAGHQRADRARAVDVAGARRHTKIACPLPSSPLMRRPRRCWPGTTAIAAACRGARCRARRPILTASGSARSCCNRPRSRRSLPYYESFVSALPRRRRAGRGAAGRRCWAPGPGSATTPARATCMPAPGAVAAAGGFPRDVAGLRALPGIGPYTGDRDRRDRLRGAGRAGGRQCGAGGRAAVRPSRRRCRARGPRSGPRPRRWAPIPPLAPGRPISPRRCSTSGRASARRPARPAALCPWRDGCAGAPAGDRRRTAAQGAETGPPGAVRGAFLADRCRGVRAAAPAPAVGPARRDDGTAGHRLARRAVAAGGGAGAGADGRRLAGGGRGAARVHAFRP